MEEEEVKGWSRTEEMNAYYEKVAPLHDRFMGYTTNEAMEELLGPVIDWVEPLVRGKRVLEIACGTGNWTQVLSRRAKSVLAVDRSQSYLDIARSKEYEGDNVTFKRADAYSLECIQGRFETAFAADWWSHIPISCITHFVRSMMGKLRPGSAVVLLDMLHSPDLDAMFSHHDDEGNCIHRRKFDDGAEFEVVKNFPSESDPREALGRFAEDLCYREHEELRRWVLTARVR